MSIHEMYEKNAPIGKVMDIAEHNCEECMNRCKNLTCPNMRALMDQAEKKIMTMDEKKRYFGIIGG